MPAGLWGPAGIARKWKGSVTKVAVSRSGFRVRLSDACPYKTRSSDAFNLTGMIYDSSLAMPNARCRIPYAAVRVQHSVLGIRHFPYVFTRSNSQTAIGPQIRMGSQAIKAGQ